MAYRVSSVRRGWEAEAGQDARLARFRAAHQRHARDRSRAGARAVHDQVRPVRLRILRWATASAATIGAQMTRSPEQARLDLLGQLGRERQHVRRLVLRSISAIESATPLRRRRGSRPRRASPSAASVRTLPAQHLGPTRRRASSVASCTSTWLMSVRRCPSACSRPSRRHAHRLRRCAARADDGRRRAP